MSRREKKYLILGLTIFICTSQQFSYAGLWALTHHSRANCGGFNETVTWWAGHDFFAHIVSHHYPYGKFNKDSPIYHAIDLGKQYTWRHAAYHTNEAYPNDTYRVIGFHYMYKNGREIEVQRDIVTNCSIYDGWWD